MKCFPSHPDQAINSTEQTDCALSPVLLSVYVQAPLLSTGHIPQASATSQPLNHLIYRQSYDKI